MEVQDVDEVGSDGLRESSAGAFSLEGELVADGPVTEGNNAVLSGPDVSLDLLGKLF